MAKESNIDLEKFYLPTTEHNQPFPFDDFVKVAEMLLMVHNVFREY